MEDPKKSSELGYFAMTQIGLEMAAPAGLGAWLDHSLGWFPWLTAVGAVLGFTLGIVEISRVNSGKKPGGDKDKPGV
jgi:F0F1-type ATP synthase assembly protein I